MRDPLLQEVDRVTACDREKDLVRQRFILEDDTGFDEVPRRYRKFYRKWAGPGDDLALNEVLCPVCKVVIRSTRELRVGDRVYCMPCMSRLVVVKGVGGLLEATVYYG